MLYATVRQRKIYVKSPVTVIQNGVNVDTLILDMDEEWKEMTSIVCVFTNGEVAKQVLHTFGNTLTVPWECLASTGSLILSVTGFVGEEKVMTTAKSETGWNIVQNGTPNGDASAAPTPQLLQQVTAAADSANSAATAANNAATAATNAKNTLEQAAANGDFDGSTPEIGKNGNWYIDGKDTGNPSSGADGKTPVVGVDYFTESDKREIVDKVTVGSKESLESAGAAQLEAINAAGSTQKQAVEDAGKAQAKAVNDAGAAQSKAVADAGATAAAAAVADVDAAKDSALEEITAAASDKADKVKSATAGHFAGLDANGNLTDSGKKPGDFAAASHSHSGYVEKVSSPVSGNLVAFDGTTGKQKDSGKKPGDFAAASHSHSGYAQALIFQNVSVAASAWSSDSTYAAYPYAATLALTGVTASHVPEVAFGATEAASGIYAPVALSGSGTVKIYAATKPTAAITVQSITCIKVVS